LTNLNRYGIIISEREKEIRKMEKTNDGFVSKIRLF